MTYEILRTMSEGEALQYTDSLSPEEAREEVKNILKTIPNTETDGYIFRLGKTFFIIKDEKILEMPDDSQSGSEWLPRLAYGPSAEEKEALKTITESCGEGRIQMLVDFLGSEVDDDLSDENIIRYFESYNDGTNSATARKVLRIIASSSAVSPRNLRDFFRIYVMKELDWDTLYYNRGGDMTDLYAEIETDGKEMGTYETLTPKEWLKNLALLPHLMATDMGGYRKCC